MIQRFDRTNLKALRNDINSALLEVAKKHGVVFSFNNISFGDTEASTRLKMLVGEPAKVHEGGVFNHQAARRAKQKEEFEMWASNFGLAKDDLGKPFAAQGKVYTIVGLNSRSSYPVIAENGRGKGYKFAVADVLRGLGRAPHSQRDVFDLSSR